MRGMNEKERSDFVAAALNNDDDATIAAVLAGPSMLSGLQPAEREAYRETWRRKRFPAEVDRISRSRKALHAFEQGGGDFLSEVRSLIEGHETRTATEAAARATAATAQQA
jgi:hypothetical protein